MNDRDRLDERWLRGLDDVQLEGLRYDLLRSGDLRFEHAAEHLLERGVAHVDRVARELGAVRGLDTDQIIAATVDASVQLQMRLAREEKLPAVEVLAGRLARERVEAIEPALPAGRPAAAPAHGRGRAGRGPLRRPRQAEQGDELVSDAFEQAFLAAVDDMNAGQLHAPEHYLRTVPAARHEEFTRRLSALRAARGPHASEPTSEAFEAALSAVAAVRAEAGQAGMLPGALKQMRKARGIRPRDVVDALAAEYELGPEGREALREHYHQLESGELVGPNIAHRLLRSLADYFQAEFEDFRAAVRPAGGAGASGSGPRLRLTPAMGRGAGDDGPVPGRASGEPRTVGLDREVELVRRLFTGGPDA